MKGRKGKGKREDGRGRKRWEGSEDGRKGNGR
jgi:hypothetical protein